MLNYLLDYIEMVMLVHRLFPLQIYLLYMQI